MDTLREKYPRGYATIDLDAICYNMASMKANLTNGTAIYGIVKADGYGHGAVPIAKAIKNFVIGYGVATIEEALNLREHNITEPIIILGVTNKNRFRDLVTNKIQPTIFQYEKAKLLSDIAVELGKTAFIHIALDTGMGRIGMEVSEKSADEVVTISKLPGIKIEGLFTHFAKADELDKTHANNQLKKYKTFLEYLKVRGVSIPICHCSNSAGIIDIKEAHMNAVRAGISIYGLYPSKEVESTKVLLKPALELKSQITYIKQLGANEGVSYGSTYITAKDTKVATIPIGYGDGYPRNLSGKGFVLIRGKRAPILGRVCMDQFMVDVTGISGVSELDEVTLIGRDQDEIITVEKISELSGIFHYEIICNLGKRIPRIYIKNGETAGVKEYFRDSYNKVFL